MTNDIVMVRQLTSKIDGWLSDSEGELLYNLAKGVPSGQAIVELGSWKGKSTVWLAKGTEAGQRDKVYSIDPHSGSKAHVSEGEMNTYTAFLTNLTKAGVQATVVPLVTTSDKAAQRWREGIGLLWVDASHEYEDVKRDFLAWKHHLLPGAIVAFHDCDKPGPTQVVEEYLNHSGDFTTIQSVDTIIVAANDKCTHYWVLDSKDIGACKYCGKKRDFRELAWQSLRKVKSE
jgi:predicted O-methyltransferase YrrM